MEIIPIYKWFSDIKKPVIIAGPCSAENKEQLLTTAYQIAKNQKVNFFRAGIWKPRTRPNNFEGVGEIALDWLREIKENTNLITGVEVATPKHIEICLKNPQSIDFIWIGARTTSSPFAVQELADNLKNVDIPVLVKNPIQPDLSLWIGAIERLYKAGIHRIAGVHRGFYPYEKSIYRNVPMWNVPIELKIKLPNISIINDPSHISGNTEYIADISQKALNLNMDGLMIETHIQPKNALSDAKQQLKPQELNFLLDNLILKKQNFKNEKTIKKIEDYRKEIDLIDKKMLEFLIKRMKISEEIGKYKKEKNITILQLSRWKEIIKTRVDFGKKIGLSSDFIKKILQLVHKESIKQQSF